MEYNFGEIEKKWQQYWKKNQVYKVDIDPDRPKFYILDMFPYPSGTGLHVGHPLGYIATDIYSRFKAAKGYNVLHPMGFDAFGLPAEQYAIETGQHPITTTSNNISFFKKQLEGMGLNYDWSREVRTSDPDYYKWTQWIFLQLFGSWYNVSTDKAEGIDTLIQAFSTSGSGSVDPDRDKVFSADEWKAMSESQQMDLLMEYRLAYLASADVNWCQELGTVLANDEVKEGLSVRGGHPVVKKSMRQWFLRITAYAERLLNDLDNLDWQESLKEMQRNWIGRSEGASVSFGIQGHDSEIEVFTTRPDTIFGATFMVLAPEHELVQQITTTDKKTEVAEYLKYVESRSERERMSEVKKVTGAFTGAYAINPFTEKEIPVWISEYVLTGYGTGAIMAVPADDDRDHAFAKKFELPIVAVIDKSDYPGAGREDKLGKMINSGFLNGMEVMDAIAAINDRIESSGMGKRRVNYRIRDAGFSRQRYWGEPFPIVYKDDICYPLDESELPVTLPEMQEYQPSGTGKSPLAAVEDWVNLQNGAVRETDTMPGYAGSSWYFLRFMDPGNKDRFVSEEAEQYWQDVDLYIGGAEHAVGHLMYARFWQKFLFDRGWVQKQEPFKQLLNQGMIQGRSSFVYRVKGTNQYVSYNLKDDYEHSVLNVDVNIVHNDTLDIDKFKGWRPENKDAEFILEDGKYVCGYEHEKMSKSKYNVVNPDDIMERYGADTFRMYEMFLGPIGQSKPWNTNGIDGVHRFIKKLWKLFIDDSGNLDVSNGEPTAEEQAILHKTIKKVDADIERFSFNTCVSAFMICVNELTDKACNKREVLEQLVVTLSPFAPHISEELWHVMGNKESVTRAPYPKWDAKYIQESSYTYPISINGKVRARVELPLDASAPDVESEILGMEAVQKWLDGKSPRKVIYVPGKIINVVV